jgi:Sulfatase/Tetratricopeptide repeat
MTRIFLAVFLAASLPAAAAPNIILISIDTLRSDHLPAYGYTAIKTPNIDRFRADAILFERAWSHYPLTAPAHASMFTGQLPAKHGIRDNSGYTLDRNVPTVAELLARRGYATGGMVSSKVLATKTGLSRGFGTYDVPSAAERDGAQTIELANRWLARRQKREPFFLFVHLYEPHTPYRKTYDDEIVRVDTSIGKLFDELRRLRLYDSSLIVFTSDHGEGLGEHGEKQHGILLYRTTLQIPLIVKLPNNARRNTRVSADAQLIDIAPTLLQQAGAPFAGISLANPIPAQRLIYAETLYPQLQLGWHELHAVIQGDLHLIAGARVEMYDVTRDPRELANIVDSQRRAAVPLLRQLRALTSPARPPAKTAPDETLLGLGYLSGGGDDDTAFRPHPPDRMPIFNPVLKLMTALRRKQYQEALAMSEDLLKKHPDYAELWERKAQALLGLGRRKEAEAAMIRALTK